MKRIPIFKPGKHTASSGVALDFSQASVDAAVVAYDPAVHQAPLVIGHPKDNGPAFGWVDKLEFNAATGEMDAIPSQVHVDLAEGVRSGAFKMRSASFYAPGSATHPLAGKPGHDAYYLRHVGFLGAMPPAVKGLTAVQFDESLDGVVEFEEGDGYEWGLVGRIMRGMRDWLLAEKGQETADRVVPDYHLQDIEARARRPMAGAMPSPSFSEPEANTMTPAEIAALQGQAARVTQLEADNAALTTQVTTLQTQAASFAEAEKAAKRTALVAQLTTGPLAALVAAGKLLPREVAGCAEFAASLDGDTAVLEFGEEPAEGTERVGRTARAHYLAQLEGRPTAVDFRELSAGDPNTTTGTSAQDLATRATAYKAKASAEGREISFTEAVNDCAANKDKPAT